ncbi:MAG: helix-hairpin-helix domain-containing protein [Gemmataceae bacterium]
MTNHQIAEQLQRHARSLAAAGHNLHRVRAFRQAAMTVLSLEGAAEAFTRPEWEALPGIGASLAATLAEWTATGVWAPRTTVTQPATTAVATLESTASFVFTPADDSCSPPFANSWT